MTTATPAAAPLRIREALGHFEGTRGRLVLSTGLGAIGTTLEASALVLIAGVAQAVTTEGDAIDLTVGPLAVTPSLGVAFVLTPTLLILAAALQLSSSAVRARLVRTWTRDRQRLLATDFLAAGWETQSATRSGQLAAVSGLATNAGSTLSNLLLVLRSGVATAILLGTAMLVSWVAAVAILALGGALFAGLRPLNRRAKQAAAAAAREQVALVEELTDLSAHAREVGAFGVAEAAGARAEDGIGKVSELQARMDVLDAAVSPLYQTAGVLLLVAALAGVDAIGVDDAATLGAVALLVLRSISYGQQLQTAWQRLQRNLPVLEALEATTATLRAGRVEGGHAELAAVDHLEVRAASYAYPDGHEAVRHVDLQVARGEAVGIIGRSGAGKTTLAELVLRLRHPTAGHVLVNGRDIGDYTTESWTARTALVPQDPILVRGTVADNIRFHRPGIDDDAVRAAAGAAGLAEVVDALPDGYDTPVGDALRGLSGGQRQRIGIARALAGDPQLLVLDEPTSALDVHAEAIVQRTIDALRQHAAVVIIAHRLTTLESCDRLLLLDAGGVRASGEPAAVLAELRRQADPTDVLDS